MLKYEVYLTDRRIQYMRHGQDHRIYSPAILWVSGYIYWCEYHAYHRLNGPAKIYEDTYKEYWIRGKRC